MMHKPNFLGVLLIIGNAIADLEHVKFEMNTTVDQDVNLAFDVNEFQTYGECDFSTTIIGETKVVKFNGRFKHNTVLLLRGELGDRELITFKKSLDDKITYKVAKGEMVDQRAYLGFEVKTAIIECPHLSCRKGDEKHSREIFFEGEMQWDTVDIIVHDKNLSTRSIFTFSTSKSTTIESSFNPIDQEMMLRFLPWRAESKDGITAMKKELHRITFTGQPPSCLTKFKYIRASEEKAEIVTESMTITFDWI